MIRGAEARIVHHRHLTATAWSNGRGRTRTIGTGPLDAPAASDAAFSWRLSLADLDVDADFSHLPGVERILVLASEGPMAMVVDGDSHRLVRGQSIAFPGEAAVSIALAPDRRETALNLMYRRGTATGGLEVVRADGELILDPAHGWVSATLLAGHAQLPDGRALEGLSTLVLGEGATLLRCEGAVIAAAAVFPN